MAFIPAVAVTMAGSAPPVSGSGPPSISADMHLQILGPLRIWRDGVELDAGPPQQAGLLALLLACAGRPISASELIELIWDDDVPASALNILQKYVGSLRRLLEPVLPARGTSSFLPRRGSGYLLASEPGMVDVVTFRELVRTAKVCLAEQRVDVALDRYVQALQLWHGPAGDGLSRGPAAMSIFAALNDEFFDASVAAAELAIARGQSERVLPPLRMAARMAPLHETVQASLVISLAIAGQQAEALSTFGAVRARLAEELGIDAGPALQAAYLRVLGQPPTETTQRTPVFTKTPAEALIGRAEELAVLRHAVNAASTGGTGLVVVEGEPGAGKTRLLEDTNTEADARGALVVWGRCLEGDGTPSMWPWVQAISSVIENLPASAQGAWQAGELGSLLEPRSGTLPMPVLPDAGAQFRLFERTVDLIGHVSARRPVMIVIDDLQWADVASLQMFSHLAARMPSGTVIIGALRDRAQVPGTELSRMLAAASRLPHHRRIRLGPLGPIEVAELVRRETGQAPSPRVARSIHARTAGNPFFVRELSRFLAEGGAITEKAAARAGVPSTVQDIVLDRMSGLADNTIGLLQIAALIGRDVNLSLLARAADLDVETCVERLEPLEVHALLEPRPSQPYSFRFAHDLVRESVVHATPPSRAARLHLRIADALEHFASGGESGAERLAHHLWAAGPLADPARTAAALVRAGRRAAAKSAFEAAAGQLASAAEVARTAGLAELELSALSQLTAVVGMRSGYVGSAVDLLERAEHLARGLNREREAADFLFSRWAGYSQGIQLDQSGRLARRLLDQGEESADPLVRAYGRHAWGIHQWDVGNVGEAVRYLTQSNTAMFDDRARREAEPLRHDLQLLAPVMLALNTALHGEVDRARVQLDRLEAGAADDPYAITVWAAFAVTVAALSNDPVWALRAAERGIAADPEHTFLFLGSYPRVARCWARAVTGHDPTSAAAEAQRIIDAALLDPPRSGLATWYGLLAEMHLAAGMLTETGAALDRADSFLETYGQRYPEGLILLLRAQLLLAQGQPVAAVQVAAERARSLSIEREAHLFAHRADELLAGLAESADH